MTALPATMTAIEITEPGGPEVLRPATRPMPTPGAGEVLIQVAAAGINRPDVMQRQGEYPPPAGASDIPGLEVAGTVAAVGLGVNYTKIGDAVCALVTGGGYADLLRGARTAMPAGADGLEHGRRRRPCRRPSSPSGPISSSAAASSQARPC